MADAIVVRDLAKTYRVAQKPKTGIWPAVKSLFHRTYKTNHAVDGISFTIQPGEIVAFLGPNGAGKTTTLKMLSGLIYPTAGTATVLGHVPWERSNEFRRSFALVMGQKNQLWWDLPARESFRLHQDIYDIPKAQFESIRNELIDLLRLGELIDQPVRELSLGERMKMELVAALLHSPRVLFLDEPTIGLDVVAQSQLRQFLRDHNRRSQTTILLTSHYMRDVETLCSRAVMINHGKLVFDGPLERIHDQFGSQKIIKLQFAGDVAPDLSNWGKIIKTDGPMVELRMDRDRLSPMLAKLLDEYRFEDISASDIPLEEVVGRIFSQMRTSDDVVPNGQATRGDA